MIAAAAMRLLQRQDDAVALYGRALQYDRRPEVYFQLGLTYLELGRRDDALEAFVAANLFVFEPEMIREIILPELQLAVEQNVTAYYRGERKLPQVIHSPPGPGRGSS